MEFANGIFGIAGVVDNVFEVDGYLVEIVGKVEGHFGEEPTSSTPIVPGCGDIIIEFNQDQTQDIRIELWDEEGQIYLGLLNSGLAQATMWRAICQRSRTL